MHHAETQPITSAHPEKTFDLEIRLPLIGCVWDRESLNIVRFELSMCICTESILTTRSL